MKIYTRSGDRGETGLIGGFRVLKTHTAIRACGELDETNSHIGLVLSESLADDIEAVLIQVQKDLFVLGSQVAGFRTESKRKVRLCDQRISWLEDSIDRSNAGLPEMDAFILPGGTTAASRLHVTRSVCRRAERSVVELAATERDTELAAAIIYLNRLSDLLFVLARQVNHCNDVVETKWLP